MSTFRITAMRLIKQQPSTHKQHKCEPITPNKKPLVTKLIVLMFLILLNTNLLRILKDSIIPLKIGVEALSFIRIFLELPLVLLWVIAYYYWISKTSTGKIFRKILWFYAIVSLILYVVSGTSFMCNKSVDVHSGSHLSICIDYWPYAISYVVFDLWPVVAYTNFFWELSNRLLTSQEAKVIYPRYQLFGQSNLLITGGIVVLSSFLGASSLSEKVHGAQTLITLVTCINFILIGRFYQSLAANAEQTQEKQSFRAVLPRVNIWKYPFLSSTFISLVSYYASICLIEIICIYHLKTLYESLTEMMLIQGLCTLCLGIVTVICSLLLRRLSKVFVLSSIMQILPYCLVILGTISFCVLLLLDVSLKVTLILFMGTFIIVRALKYTIFDSTKEIMNIPFQNEIKLFGKGVDMLGVGMGRFLAHLFPVIFFSGGIYSNFEQAYSGVALLLCSFAFMFFISTHALCKLMKLPL